MSLADIKAKISAESQAQIRSIESENDSSIQAIKNRTDTEVKAVQDTYAQRLAKEEPQVLKRREIVAELDAKKADLGTKQRLVSEAFDASLRQLAELSADKYKSFAGKLLKEAVKTGKEVLLVGNKEKYLDQAWLDGFNTANQTSVTLSSERLPITGGFVLRDDKIDINCSWEMLIENIRSEIESDVVKKLFS